MGLRINWEEAMEGPQNDSSGGPGLCCPFRRGLMSKATPFWGRLHPIKTGVKGLALVAQHETALGHPSFRTPRGTG